MTIADNDENLELYFESIRKIPLVTRQEEAVLAGKIAKNAPIAVRACKKAINEGLDVDMDKAIVIEEKLFGSCFESEDQKEGMLAFLEKRKVEGFKNK